LPDRIALVFILARLCRANNGGIASAIFGRRR
jgi:hypothetical protein